MGAGRARLLARGRPDSPSRNPSGSQWHVESAFRETSRTSHSGGAAPDLHRLPSAPPAKSCGPNDASALPTGQLRKGRTALRPYVCVDPLRPKDGTPPARRPGDLMLCFAVIATRRRRMAQLTVRDVNAQVVAALERRAAANRRPAEAEHRAILHAALLADGATFADCARGMRQRLKSSVDSRETIRADRGRDGAS